MIEGFAAKLDIKAVGYAPVAGFVLMVGAVLVMLSVADWRLSFAPWLLGSSVVCLALCCVGVLKVHLPDPRRSIKWGVVLTILSLLALASFPFAVGMGGVLGIEEEEAGVLALLPLLASGFGLVGMTPGLAMAAFGAGADGTIPKWGVWALWVASPLLPLTAVVGGIAEPAAAVGFILLPLVWVVIGASLLRAKPLSKLPHEGHSSLRPTDT